MMQCYTSICIVNFQARYSALALCILQLYASSYATYVLYALCVSYMQAHLSILRLFVHIAINSTHEKTAHVNMIEVGGLSGEKAKI